MRRILSTLILVAVAATIYNSTDTNQAIAKPAQKTDVLGIPCVGYEDIEMQTGADLDSEVGVGCDQ